MLQGLAACGAQAGQGGNCASAGLGTAAGVIANAVLNNPHAMTSEEKKAREDLITTLVAGAAAGGDAGSAVAGVQVEVENNALAHVLAAANKQKPGTVENYEAATQAAIKEACSGGTPVSCETAVAAMGSAMAWPLLPAAAGTTSLIGAGANAGVGWLINGEVNPNDVILGYWTGALTAGTGLWGTMAVNGGSSATSSWLKGEDPLKGGLIGMGASGLGYGVGKVAQGQLDKVLNPMKPWKDWIWVDVGMGISKPMPLDPLPGITGNVIGSGATEFTNDQVGKKIDEIGGEK